MPCQGPLHTPNHRNCPSSNHRAAGCGAQCATAVEGVLVRGATDKITPLRQTDTNQELNRQTPPSTHPPLTLHSPSPIFPPPFFLSLDHSARFHAHVYCHPVYCPPTPYPPRRPPPPPPPPLAETPRTSNGAQGGFLGVRDHKRTVLVQVSHAGIEPEVLDSLMAVRFGRALPEHTSNDTSMKNFPSHDPTTQPYHTPLQCTPLQYPPLPHTPTVHTPTVQPYSTHPYSTPLQYTPTAHTPTVHTQPRTQPRTQPHTQPRTHPPLLPPPRLRVAP